MESNGSSPFNTWPGRAAAGFARARARFDERSARWAAMPSWGQRAVGALVLCVVVGLGVILLFWSLIVGVAVLACAAAVVGVRGLWRRIAGRASGTMAPPGARALRRNVRVVRTDERL